MKNKITVAAVQMYIKPRDIGVNLTIMSGLLEEIKNKGGCDLVVFPEDCITGPIPNDLNLAMNLTSKPINELRLMAKKYKTYIVPGSFIQKKKDKYFNTAILINPKGEIVLEYRKNNLWHPERNYLSKGNKLPIVKTSLGTIGIIICWDLAFPESCRELAKNGADIICCPSYWTVDDGKPLHKKYGKLTEHIMVNTLCPARSIENEILFIYANGAEEAQVKLKEVMWRSPQIGQTQICAPILGRVKHIADNLQDYILYQYNRQMAKDAEKNYKIRQDVASQRL